MYADDTSLTFASADVKDINDCLNYDLSQNVYAWLTNLTLNLTKLSLCLLRQDRGYHNCQKVLSL